MKKHLFYAVLLSATMLTLSAADKKAASEKPYTDDDLSRISTSVFFQQKRSVINEDRYLTVSKIRKEMNAALKAYCDNPSKENYAALRKAVDNAADAFLKMEVIRAEQNLEKAKQNLKQKDGFTDEVMKGLMKKIKNAKYVPGSAGK